jgi:hypothetical protein
MADRNTGATTASDPFFTPADACTHAGGRYLGEFKCRLADGKIVPILNSVELLKEKESSTAIAEGTPRSWALATTAIVFESTGCRHDLLAGAIVVPNRVKSQKESLKQWWNIGSRDDLMNTLYWLQYSGHRKEFEDLGRHVDALSSEQFEAAKIRQDIDDDLRHKLYVVRRYHRRLGGTGILAWDLIRYIALCRWGYSVGYLSEDEAWNLIMPAALRLQKSFGSWKEMQNNYLIGREFWSLQQTNEEGARYHDIFVKLLREPGSPWVSNPWNMDLHIASPLPIVAIGTGG